jgi:putative solute:sodium symporter small subunit
MTTTSNESQASRWQGTLRRTLLLLAIWLVAGPVCGILLVDRLNAFQVGGLPMGFWIAFQGSIYVFVVLIFLNAVLADRADRA